MLVSTAHSTYTQQPYNRYLITTANVLLCIGCAVSANSIPCRPISSSLIGGFAFLTGEALLSHKYPRRWFQLTVGTLITAGGGAIASIVNQGSPAIIGWGVGTIATHTNSIWSRCLRSDEQRGIQWQ